MFELDSKMSDRISKNGYFTCFCEKVYEVNGVLPENYAADYIEPLRELRGNSENSDEICA
jgi:hypothetical protein